MCWAISSRVRRTCSVPTQRFGNSTTKTGTWTRCLKYALSLSLFLVVDVVRQVIASYMFEGLHGKLFGSMCDIHSDEDANLMELSLASRESVSLSQVMGA